MNSLNIPDIGYIDMDGVTANFMGAMYQLCPEIDNYPMEERHKMVDDLCAKNSRVFLNLEPIQDSIESIKYLMKKHEIYFLSTPMWHVHESFTDKRLWIDRYFGAEAEKRLILSHRKDLNFGKFLIDDRIAHGVDLFVGEHIHIFTHKFPDWKTVIKYIDAKY